MKHTNSTETDMTQLHLILSRFSHEIRNPIGLLSSQLQLITQEHPEIQNYDGWDNITSNLDYLCALLDDLSDYNHADLLHFSSVPMTKFLLSILGSVKPTFNYLGITLTTQIDENLPTLLIDETKIRQAILNLLRNAEEAIPSSGQIQVEAYTKGDFLYIIIQDNGCGILPEHLSSIFDPFITHKSGGTGLGLAITKQIITSHQGQIQVESDPSKGSSFTVLLPLQGERAGNNCQDNPT